MSTENKSRLSGKVARVIAAFLAVIVLLAGLYGLSFYLWIQEMQDFMQAYQSDDYLTADAHIKRCLELSSPFGPGDLRYLKSVQFQAALYATRRNFQKAETLARQAVSLAKNNFGPESVESASQKSALALILRKTEKYPESERLYKEALAVYEKEKVDDETASILDYLAWVLIKEKKFDEARTVLERCLILTEQKYGVRSYKMISPWVELAYLQDLEGKWEEAQTLLRRSLDFFRKQKAGEKTSAYTVVAILTMANMYRQHGYPAEAEYCYKQALNSCRQNVAGGENNLFMTDIQKSYASMLKTNSRLEEARALEAEAEKIRARPALK